MKNCTETRYTTIFPYYFFTKDTALLLYYGTLNEYSEDSLWFKKNIAELYNMCIMNIYEK